MITSIGFAAATVLLISVAVFWVRLARGARRRPTAPTPNRYPSITVIRPVRGEDVGALDNFRAQLSTGYPGAIETIFVFDDDRDAGLPLARLAVAEHAASGRAGGAEIIIAGAPPAGRTGKLHAMIVGLAHARHELVAFGDSDTRPDQQVLPKLVEALLADEDAGSAFAPLVVNKPAAGFGDALYAIMQNAMYAPFAAYAARKNGSLPFIMGQLMVFRRQALSSVGGPACAQGQLVDDMAIGRCLHRAGWRNLLVPQGLHVETGGLTLGKFLPIYRRWIQFARNGLPLSFIWPQVVIGTQFFVGAIAAGGAAVSGRLPLAAAFAAVATTVAAMLLDLNRRSGGARMSVRYWAAPLLFFALSPVVVVGIMFRRRVVWRARVYDLGRRAALAPSQSEAIENPTERSFPSTERQRRIIVLWSLISGVVHVAWEGTWSMVAPLLVTPSSQHGWTSFWTLYARADARYVHADSFVRILELFTGTVVAALNLWAAYQFRRRQNTRSATVILLIASVMEVYGTVMYFGSEMLNGWANLDTSSFVHTWVMFVGLNTLWLVFPGWCIYEILAVAIAPERARVPSAAERGNARLAA